MTVRTTDQAFLVENGLTKCLGIEKLGWSETVETELSGNDNKWLQAMTKESAGWRNLVTSFVAFRSLNEDPDCLPWPTVCFDVLPKYSIK